MAFRRMDVFDVPPERNRMRIGSSARIPLATVGLTTAEQRTQGVVRLDDAQSESWRVTLGTPQVVGVGSVPTVGATSPTVIPNVSWGAGANPARAIVEWGVDGASYTAVMDWRKGTTFVLHASSINIAAQSLQTIEPGNPASTGFVIFPASIAPSYSLTPQSVAPSFTVRAGSVLAGNSIDTLVPNFARTLRIYRAEGATPPEVFELTFFADPAATQVVYFDQFGAGAGRNLPDYAMSPFTVPVPPSAQYLRFRNGPATVNNQTLMFEYQLDLG